MKLSFISLFSFLLSMWSGHTKLEDKPVAAPTIPVCGMTGMNQFANDPAFRAMHPNPLPFHYVSKAGETVTFNTPDGKKASGFLIKSAKPSDKWLLVYQEWWGLNDYIKQQSEMFHNDLKNVNVLALDMYDGKVATEQTEAAKLMQGADKNRLGAIMQGAIAYVGPKAEIASLGWCFGGGLSLQSAILAGKQAKGCVMYYGFPETDVEKLKKLDTDVLGLFGSKDGFISPKTVNEFEDNMKKAGEKIEVKMYDADHAFANPSNPKYDKAATADANKRALTYLKDRLKA